MNKSDLITNLSKKLTYLDKQDIDLSISCLLERISKALHDRDRIELRGFGSFSSREKKSHLTRNPKTGQVVSIDSKFHPYFRASKSLKKELNT